MTWKSENSYDMQVTPAGVVTAPEPTRGKIIATSAAGTGAIVLDAFRPLAPEAPSSFHARAVSDTEIQMAWRSGRGWTEEFRVERETVLPPSADGSPAATSFVSLVALPDTAHGDLALSPGQAYRYRVQACNRHGCSGYSPTMSVATFPTLHIETAELPVANLGVQYSVNLKATPGTGPLVWNLIAGALPPSFEISDSTLVGWPNRAGVYTFTLRATGAGQTADRSFTLEVSAAPVAPIITTTSLPEGIVGQSYERRLYADLGDKIYAWAVVDGQLPPGLTMAADGEITGTPSAIGEFGFTVEVTSAGMTDTGDLAIRITYPPVAIEMALLPASKEGDPYSQTLRANGGDGENFAWSLVSGQLPPGVTLGATTGKISGTPTAAGFFPFTVRVNSGGRTATQNFYIDVYNARPLIIENWYLPVVIQGTPYSEKIEVTGGDSPENVFRLTGGSLPPFFSLDPASGVISGTATGFPGTYFFTVEIQNDAQKVVRTFALTVSTVGREGFNVAVINVSNAIPNSNFIRGLNEAISKWESVITTDFPSFTMPGDLSSDYCQGHGEKLREGNVIEDFVILLGVYQLDGPGGVVGRAGPCGYVIGDPGMLRSGSFMMDQSDIPYLTPEQLKGVSIHEIGHALGIGTMWDIFGRDLITGKGGADPRYTGQGGVAGYKSLGGAYPTIAIENSGSEGTRDGHWRESVFDTEVMTGYIEASGVRMQLSTMSVRSLEDLGYAVNAAAADAYTLPWDGFSAVESEQGSARIDLGDDVVMEPLFRVLPGGSLRLEPRR